MITTSQGEQRFAPTEILGQGEQRFAPTNVEASTPQSSVLSPQSSIVVVDYGLGNLRSVINAFAAIGHPATLTSDPAMVRVAARIVLPGVGAAGEAMRRLRELGLDDAVREAAAAGKPTLGLCLGMQLFFDYSEENDTPCLGLLPGTVKLIRPTRANNGSPLRMMPPRVNNGSPLQTNESTIYNLQSTIKIPHIGWSQLTICQPHPLLAGMDGEYIYFVHSYVCQPTAPGIALATADYGGAFVAIVGRDNIIAVQGHPERSDVIGLGFLRRFAEWL